MLIGADVTRSAGPLNNVTVTGATTMADTRHEVSIARADDASFEDLGRRTQLAYRDLGVRAATGGRYHAHIMRTSGTGDGLAVANADGVDPFYPAGASVVS